MQLKTQTKRCHRCSEVKATSEFFFVQHTGKPKSQCKICMKEVGDQVRQEKIAARKEFRDMYA
jgi:hypothetical protein